MKWIALLSAWLLAAIYVGSSGAYRDLSPIAVAHAGPARDSDW